MHRFPKVAPEGGPKMTIRLRTRKELDLITKAAKDRGLTLNTFVAEIMSQAAQEILAKPRGNREAPAQDLEQSA
jgi:uncharacterized protein (DUF1778 family)